MQTEITQFLYIVNPTMLNESIETWLNAGNSKPVAKSLAMLDTSGLLRKVEGHTKGMSLFPFAVYLKDGGIICKPTELHQYVSKITEGVKCLGRWLK